MPNFSAGSLVALGIDAISQHVRQSPLKISQACNHWLLGRSGFFLMSLVSCINPDKSVAHVMSRLTSHVHGSCEFSCDVSTIIPSSQISFCLSPHSDLVLKGATPDRVTCARASDVPRTVCGEKAASTTARVQTPGTTRPGTTVTTHEDAITARVRMSVADARPVRRV